MLIIVVCKKSDIDNINNGSQAYLTQQMSLRCIWAKKNLNCLTKHKTNKTHESVQTNLQTHRLFM